MTKPFTPYHYDLIKSFPQNEFFHYNPSSFLTLRNWLRLCNAMNPLLGLLIKLVHTCLNPFKNPSFQNPANLFDDLLNNEFLVFGKGVQNIVTYVS